METLPQGRQRLDLAPVADPDDLLQRGDAKYKLIVESSPDAILLLDAEGAITEINQRGADMIGRKRADVVGKFYMDLPHLSREAKARMAESFGKTGRNRDVAEFETEFTGAHGHKKSGLVTLTPIKSKNDKLLGALVVISDITHLKQLQQQFLQAQRLESVGRLAGGIAHDFNNVLLTIIGHSELLLAAMEEKDPRRDDVLEIRKSVNSAAAITRQLLAFSRKQMLEPKVVDVNAIIHNMQTMLKRLLGEDVKLTVALDQKLRHVHADAGQIEQVIMNLTVNARDAMPEGGKLTVSTECASFRAEDIAGIPDARPGEFVCIAVADTGTGMKPEVVAHVFEPFFTTKEKEKGTGLGLATVYGIVKQHGGWITVQSEAGRGSTFRICLPVSLAKMEAIAPVVREAKVPDHKTASCRILLVEDEQNVREPMARALQANGHHVVDASTAGEALSIFERDTKGFDMLFSDVVLPDRTGVDVAEYVTQRSPRTKVLLFSGYSDERARWDVIKQKGYYFLQKPFATAELLQELEKMIKNGNKASQPHAS
jgi:PAS domain S-box-containing protein